MPRHVAFLRAINVGGHVVRMTELKAIFEGLGFTGVETFIASGNVVFTAASKDQAAIERRIERTLKAALGYEVATFVRSCEELAAIAAMLPFAPDAHACAGAFVIGLLKEPLAAPAKKKVLAFGSEIDAFHVDGREVYWLCHHKQSESTFSNAAFERALGVSSTWRGVNTMRKMAAKYPVR